MAAEIKKGEQEPFLVTDRGPLGYDYFSALNILSNPFSRRRREGKRTEDAKVDNK